MKQFSYTITDPMGIHARPAGMLVKAAAGFADSSIKISNGTKEVDAKRLMAVMSLGVKQGHTVTFTIEGGDEGSVAESLESFMKENL
ncbi:MAG: HPr family phosphocarrier protein [Lachnospiraceae bacterium]